MSKSIREFADELGVSHTAIRNIIAKLETELEREIGISQGNGKSTLLSDDEQQLIKSKIKLKSKAETALTVRSLASLPYSTALSSASVEPTPYQVKHTIDVQPIEVQNFDGTLNDNGHSDRLANVSLTSNLTLRSNFDQFRAARRQMLRQLGQIDAVEDFSAYSEGYAITRDALNLEQAKVTGLAQPTGKRTRKKSSLES
jgi:molybdenum-dependent DNA-binding transcriptional regulator ModE